jgi:hypothetical protein
VQVVPDKRVWAALPEANRQMVVGQLVRLASRALTLTTAASERGRR